MSALEVPRYTFRRLAFVTLLLLFHGAGATVAHAQSDGGTSDAGTSDGGVPADGGTTDGGVAPDGGVASDGGSTNDGVSTPDDLAAAAARHVDPFPNEPVPTEELDSQGPDFVPTLPEPAPERPPATGVRRELAGFPAVAANSQYGFVIGASGSLTRFADGYSPFLLRAQLTAAVAMRGSDSGFESPLQNVDLRIDLPGRGPRHARIFILTRFTHVLRAGYFGIGNGTGSTIPDDYAGPRDRYFMHERFLAEQRAFARFRIARHVEAVFGGGARWVKPSAFTDSLLARDIAEAKLQADPVLRGYTQQAIFDGLLGLLIDHRDDEINPTRGGYHEISVRAGGGPAAEGGFGYASVTLNTRWFLSLLGEKLVLAGRAVADIGGGGVPLIELGTIGGYASFAGTAGPEANRGLLPGRQLGRVKLLGSLELRSTFWRFQIKKSRLALGAVAFADTSRVRARLLSQPGEGGGPILRSSFGGGVRLLWGSAFIFRVDVGISPHGGIDGNRSIQVTAILNQAF